MAPNNPVEKISPTVRPSTISNTMLFVPYWTLTNGVDKNYSEYIYFGITPGAIGINRAEPGYKNIPLFLQTVPGNAQKLLGVRMTNTVDNETILQNEIMQKKITTDTVQIAKENGFDGVVLDFEYNAFSFDSVIQSVSTFSERFASAIKDEKLVFYQTIYGDTYYRGRPYKVNVLAKNADKILVMAYDFHKANGDPGPNFPLEAGDEGYSFHEMISNFTKDVPVSKLTVIFGMFGYDWKISDKGNSMGQADSLSTNEILQKFITTCAYKKCVVVSNPSLEKKVNYVDNAGQKHEVWFEDRNSLSRKEALLQKNGISSEGFWANGYF